MFVYSKGIVGDDETLCVVHGQGLVWEVPVCLYIVKR